MPPSDPCGRLDLWRVKMRPPPYCSCGPSLPDAMTSANSASLRAMRILTAAVLPLALVIGLGSAATPAANGASSSLREHVQLALTEYRSGLRHEDGELTCSRMTLRLRRAALSALASEGTAGLGCVSLVEIYGRELYNDMKDSGRRVRSVTRTVRNGARARTTTGGTFCVRLVDRRWRVDSTEAGCR